MDEQRITKWLAMLALIVATPGSDGSSASQSPCVHVVIINAVGTDQSTLRAAQEIARRIFAHAGIRLTFRTHDPRSIARLPNGEVRCDGEGTVFVRIIAEPRDGFVSGNTLGYAIPAQEGSEYATVLYTRALALTSGGQYRLAVLLGHGIAHELGHLLDLRGHAPHGLMASLWTRTDLERAGVGLLGFSPADAAHMRAEVRRRFAAAGK